MSTDLRLASWNDMPKAAHDTAHHHFKIRALMPARQNLQSAKPQGYRFASKTLVFVLALHILAFTLLFMINPAAVPVTEDTSPPMLVSLVESPVINQEVVEPKLVEPKPEPVVKKPTPKPQEKPTPQVQNAPSPIPEAAPQEIAPPPVAASAPVVTKPAEVIEKSQPVEEPKPEVVKVDAVGIVKDVLPVYSTSSRRLGEEGTVVLKITISEKGVPTLVEIAKSSGYARLDAAAVAAAKDTLFTPYKRNGKAIPVSLPRPYKFSFSDE